MADIKPIETVYNGYKFRSRLEARWALFFDALGIEYEYENEGYDLGDGVWYLPDFYLPKHKVFVEIKPPYSVTSYVYYEMRDFKLCQRFNEKTGFPIILCHGLPKERWYDILIKCNRYDKEKETLDFEATFGGNGEIIIKAERCWNFYIGEIDASYNKHLVVYDESYCDYLYNEFFHGHEDVVKLDQTEIFYSSFNAAKIAKMARFEHGERPNKEVLNAGD